MGKEAISRYEGQELTIIYERALCMHAAECGRSEGELFDASKDPWCTPDATPLKEATGIVERCPSGALRYERKDGVSEATPTTNEMMVSPSGPVYLRGDIALRRPDGSTTKHTRVALCRCGESANKPFCDGAHTKAVFRDNGAVGATGPGCDAPSGEITVTPGKNGPVKVEGAFQIRAGSGQVRYSGNKVFLCRCGKSQNRPFCDGAHTKRQFEADGI